MKNNFFIVIFLVCNALQANQPEIDYLNNQTSYKIAVIGTGYVGLVLGAGLAEFGHYVKCADIDAEKIKTLNQGIIPIFEPGLPELVEKNINEKRLFFTDDIDEAIKTSEIIFIAVGTPTLPDGKADISAVVSVIKRIIIHADTYKIVCTKSTVPIGMSSIIKTIISEMKTTPLIDLVSNPEFLREGTAVYDFFNPDRVVIGAESEKAAAIMYNIFAPLKKTKTPFLTTDIPTAETIKYASNGFLAIKLSFINEIANLCDETGANIFEVAQGIGLDKRIGPHFLKPGPGFGGSCLPKDLRALLKTAEELNVDLKMIRAALEANDFQKNRVVLKVCSLLGNCLEGKTIGIWGLAFKANTDDIRESPAINAIQQLLDKGAFIKAYDPIAMDNMKKIFPSITYCTTKEEAAKNTDLILILTEWDEFKAIDSLRVSSSMKQPIIFDTRNIFTHKSLN